MLQQQQTSARSQYQYLPSGPNSIPPSRDPKQQQSTGVVAPPGPPSQVGTPTMAIQPHLTSVPAAAGATATAAAIQAAQPLPATTSVPQPSVGGSGVTAVSSAGVPAAQAGAQGVSGQQQQTQGGSVAQVQVQQPSAQPVPAQPQTYLESVNRDSHPIPSDELVERLEDISKQQGSPDAAEDSER